MKNTRRKTLLAALLVTVLLLAGASTPLFAGGGQEKVTVCHKPGTPAELTLEIAAPAEAAHLAHGDTPGECGQVSESDGCQALNLFVPDPQTDPEYYLQSIEASLNAGETVQAAIEIVALSKESKVGATLEDASGTRLAGYD